MIYRRRATGPSARRAPPEALGQVLAERTLPQEVCGLRDRLVRTLAMVEATTRRERLLSRYIGHELRTPLAAARASQGPVRIILRNPLWNALRHSKGTAIAVHVEPSGFAVVDDGRGIAPEDIPRLSAKTSPHRSARPSAAAEDQPW